MASVWDRLEAAQAAARENDRRNVDGVSGGVSPTRARLQAAQVQAVERDRAGSRGGAGTGLAFPSSGGFAATFPRGKATGTPPLPALRATFPQRGEAVKQLMLPRAEEADLPRADEVVKWKSVPGAGTELLGGGLHEEKVAIQREQERARRSREAVSQEERKAQDARLAEIDQSLGNLGKYRDALHAQRYQQRQNKVIAGLEGEAAQAEPPAPGQERGEAWRRGQDVAQALAGTYQPVVDAATIARNTPDGPARGMRAMRDGMAAMTGLDETPYAELEYLDQRERETLEAFIQAGRYDKAGEYYEAIRRELGARRFEAASQRVQELPGKTGTFDRAVLLPMAGNLSAPEAYAQVWADHLQRGEEEKYAPADIDTGAAAVVRLGGQAQGRTVDDVEKFVEEKTGSKLAADVTGFLTDTGYSMLNNAVNMTWGPQMSLVVMGLQSAGQSAVNALERGGTTGQALTTGTLSGAIEALTEKLPTDNLFQLIGQGGKRTTRQAVKEVLRQAGIEATEETVGAYLDLLNDVAVMGDRSEFSLYRAQLEAEGLSPQEARNEAMVRFFVAEPLKSGLAGAVSGGVMAGTTVGLQQAGGTVSEARADRAIDSAYGAMLESGPFSTQAQEAMGRADQRLNMLPRAGEVQSGLLPTWAEIQAANSQTIQNLESGQEKTASTGETAYRAAVPENVELPTVPIINLSMADVAALNRGALPDSGGYLRRTAVQRARARLGLNENSAAYIPASNVLRNGEEYVLKITKASLDKMFSPSDGSRVPAETVAVMENLERIANNGVYFRSEGDRKGRDSIQGVDHLMTTVYIDGQPYVVDMRVRIVQREAGNQAADNVLYYLTPEEITAIKADGGTSAAGRHASDGEAPPSSNTTLPRKQGDVNMQGAQVGGGLVLDGQESADPRSQAEREAWDALQARKSEGQADSGRSYGGTPATDKLGLKVERPITDLGAAQSLRALEQARYEAGRALDRLMKESHADKADLEWAKLVADGTMRLQQLPRGMNAGLVSELAQAVRLRDSYNRKAIQEQKARTNWNFDALVEQMIARSDEKKSPGAMSLNANTMQRNNVRVWGEDAGDINQELFDPVIANEAERIRFVNRMLGQMEQYHLTTKESALVQRLMEGELSREQLQASGHDAQRLEAAAKTMAGLYSDFYDAINDFLVAHGYKEIGFRRNYAPHMQEEQSTTLQRYLARLGFPVEVTELPTDLAGRTDTFRPGKQWNPYFQHRVGTKTEYDAVGGFESYVNYLSNVLYHTDDIQKLRRFSDALRTKYGSAELGAELDRIAMLQDRMATEDAGLAETDVQAMRDEAIQRYGNMSKFGNYVSVVDDYTNILAGKQSKFDRAVESLFRRRALNLGRNIQNAFARSAILGNLSSAINQAVQIPQVMAEVGPKYTSQAVYDVATGVTGKTGFNQESDFLTGKTGIRSIADKTGYERFFDVAAKPFEVVDDFASRVIVRAKYLEQVAQGKSHAEALKAADNFANQVVGSRMKGAKPILFEQKNPFSKVVTTFQLEVANGWAHITQDLPMEIQTLARTQGKGAAAKRVAQLVVATQLCNFIANAIIKSITGREPVPFDGLGMLANYMASGYGMTKEDYMKQVADNAAEAVTGARPFGSERERGKFELPRAAKTLGEDALEDVPYLSNLTTLAGVTDGRLPLPSVTNKQLSGGLSKIGAAVFGGEEVDRGETLKQGLMETAHGAALAGATWLPMGSQIKKTAQGVTALARGGAYSGYGESEKLQYAIDRSPANWARGALFGKSALPETDRYYAEGVKALSEKQTAVYNRLIAQGADGSEVYTLIQELRGTGKNEENSQTMERLHVLQSSLLPVEQQAEVYAGLLASDSEREWMDRMELRGVDRGTAFRALVELKEAKGTGEGQTARQREALLGLDGLTDTQKAMMGQEIIGDSRWMDYSSEAALALSLLPESAREKAEEARAAGIADEVFVAAYEAQKGVEGDGSRLSKDRAQKAAIDAATPELTYFERLTLYELFGVSESVWGAAPTAGVMEIRRRRGPVMLPRA